jgi:hypothetical protein
MPRESTLLLVERLLPEEAGQADAPVLLVDVLMLVVTGGGSEPGRSSRRCSRTPASS